jgi:hypothetical protein
VLADVLSCRFHALERVMQSPTSIQEATALHIGAVQLMGDLLGLQLWLLYLREGDIKTSKAPSIEEATASHIVAV